MRSGDDRHQFGDVGYFSIWFRGIQAIPQAGGPYDRCGNADKEDGPDGQADL